MSEAATRLSDYLDLLQRALEGAAADQHLPVSRAQLQMLLALARNPQARLQRLAQELELSAPTVSVGIRRLEALGLVERQSDTTDQRAIRLQLTATGEQLCELARDASRARAQILLDRLKPPEQKQLLTLLERALGLPVTRTTTAPDHEAQAQKKTTTAAESGQLSLFS
ncbi:MAG: MarR family transcriptional regulator [Chloroflexi bacterium]|nr:MarR family transcriptional regulator [Chloroflexota bacterium]